MIDCESCGFLENIDESRLVYDGQFWRLELNPDQQYLGKSVATLKRHASSLAELTQEEGREFWELVKKFEAAVSAEFRPTHFNWSCLMNNAVGESAPVHVHWHAIPRYKEKRIVHGTEFVDQRWPKSARDMEANKLDTQTMEIIRDTINKSF
jgi:diadenosine tetraphosphate (Ap4A) HIT family hydrolase